MPSMFLKILSSLQSLFELSTLKIAKVTKFLDYFLVHLKNFFLVNSILKPLICFESNIHLK